MYTGDATQINKKKDAEPVTAWIPFLKEAIQRPPKDYLSPEEKKSLALKCCELTYFSTRFYICE